MERWWGKKCRYFTASPSTKKKKKNRGKMDHSPSFSQNFQGLPRCSQVLQAATRRRKAQERSSQFASQIAPIGFCRKARHQIDLKVKGSLKVTFHMNSLDATSFSTLGQQKGTQHVKGMHQRGGGRAAHEIPGEEWRKRSFLASITWVLGRCSIPFPSDGAPLS